MLMARVGVCAHGMHWRGRGKLLQWHDHCLLALPQAAKDALEAVPSVKDISDRQKDYIFTLLDLDDNSQMTFRMFAVMTALACS